MSDALENPAVDNFTAFVKSNSPPPSSFPEVIENGPPNVTNLFSPYPPPPTFNTKDLAAKRHGSPRHDSVPSRLPASNSIFRTHHRSAPPSVVPVRRGLSAVAGANNETPYAKSSVSITSTTRTPSPRSFLRKVVERHARPPSTVNDDNDEPEELPHLHDFLLRASTSFGRATASAKPGSLSDPTPSAPLLHNCNSFTQPTSKPEDSLQCKRSSTASQKTSLLTTTTKTVTTARPLTSGNSRSWVSEPSVHQQNQIYHPASRTETTKPPPRQMVRRSPVTAVPEQRPAVAVTVYESPPESGDTTRSWEAGSPLASAKVPVTEKLSTLIDLPTPSFHDNTFNDTDAAAHAASVGAGLMPDLPIRETFPIPRYCPDDLLQGEGKLWCPGKPLRIAYVTWNMANKAPRMDEVSAYCIHPNAHFVVVGTQENGPYVGTNTLQKKWAKMVGDVCLGGQYELVGKDNMWAIQMLVFARKRDVAKYVSRAHASHVKTGMPYGWGGNKGGVAVGLVLSLTPKVVDISHAEATQHAVMLSKVLRTDDGKDAATPGAEETDDVQLSPSAVAGPLPPALLSASVMQHDADDDDEVVNADQAYSRHLRGQSSSYTVLEEQNVGRYHNSTKDDYFHQHTHTRGLDIDSVFSPAEVVSRNASFDLSRERQRRRKQNRSLKHSFKRKHRGNNEGNRSHNRCHDSNSRIHHCTDAKNNDGCSDDDACDGSPESDAPNYMTLLFITAHLAAHQGAVDNRNKDYCQIVHGLQLGRRGTHRKFFKRLLKQRRVLDDGEEEDGDKKNDEGRWDDDSSEEDVTPLSLPVVSAIVDHNRTRRDVTEEFDLTFFGGDLNYRINGTRKAIEYVIQHHRNIRSILINNDQLSLERARGTVFQGYQEGNLLFRPTYKYEVSSRNGGVTLDEYNFSRKKDRMPAYCDRVLFKKRPTSAARRVAIRLYTDVPNVRTSDHRPVVALFDVGTRACTG